MMNARVTLASILSSVHQLEGQISDLSTDDSDPRTVV